MDRLPPQISPQKFLNEGFLDNNLAVLKLIEVKKIDFRLCGSPRELFEILDLFCHFTIHYAEFRVLKLSHRSEIPLFYGCLFRCVHSKKRVVEAFGKVFDNFLK